MDRFDESVIEALVHGNVYSIDELYRLYKDEANMTNEDKIKERIKRLTRKGYLENLGNGGFRADVY